MSNGPFRRAVPTFLLLSPISMSTRSICGKFLIWSWPQGCEKSGIGGPGGEIGVNHEHRASYETLEALAKLQSRISIRPPGGRTVLLAALGEEQHEIGLRCASYLFESEGWRTHYLGARTPVQAVVATLLSSLSLLSFAFPSRSPSTTHRCEGSWQRLLPRPPVSMPISLSVVVRRFLSSSQKERGESIIGSSRELSRFHSPSQARQVRSAQSERTFGTIGNGAVIQQKATDLLRGYQECRQQTRLYARTFFFASHVLPAEKAGCILCCLRLLPKSGQCRRSARIRRSPYPARRTA